jgi:outer membrane lipoprotein-sorting protein
MNINISLLMFALGFGVSASVTAAVPPSSVATTSTVDAAVLQALSNMEYLRGFKDSAFRFATEVVTMEGDKVVGRHQLDVKISNQGYALIDVMAPKNEQGRRTLIRDKDLWLFLPSSANVVRIAPLQRVFGAASIADVLNTSYLKNYQVVQHSVDASTQRMAIQLQSTAKDSTYARIDIDYDTALQRPRSTRHYTASGRLLKTIEYKSFVDHHGQAKLEKIAIQDSLRQNAVVWIKMSDYQMAEFADAQFSKAALRKR